MQLYPSNIETKLGFDKIKVLIASNCESQLGKAKIGQMVIQDQYQAIDRLLDSTLEQLNQITAGDSFPTLNGFQISSELEKSDVVGYCMTAEMLFELSLNLELIKYCVQFFRNREQYPFWKNICDKIDIQNELQKLLEQTFDSRGNIKSSASNKLKKLRQAIKSKEIIARKELESILRLAGEKGYTEKDSGLTIRDGRLVLPLQAEHKRRIKGLIVDESTTGKTVYLEPLQVFNYNNEIRELRFAENREIIAILTVLTAKVGAKKKQLLQAEEFLADLDFTRAKAKVAFQLNSCKPTFTNSQNIELRNARHPILVSSNKKLGLPVVPLNILINDEQRVIIISGPNAGGKSVCLKTVGILQLMLQSGMLVPVDEGIFNGMF